MIPTGASLLASDTAFFCRLPLEQVECQAAQGREVLGSMACTGPRLVFSEADVHVPVHLVLDPQVAAHRFGEAGYVAREAGEVVRRSVKVRPLITRTASTTPTLRRPSHFVRSANHSIFSLCQ